MNQIPGPQRHWYDERSFDDAPIYLGADEAQAWAAGWNAAVRAFDAEFTANLAKEHQ